jgi:hypothetical protein
MKRIGGIVGDNRVNAVVFLLDRSVGRRDEKGMSSTIEVRENRCSIEVAWSAF